MLGWFDEKAVKKILNIPKDRKVDLLISAGYYTDGEREKARRPLDEVSSYNRY
jgi:nitroreductase